MGKEICNVLKITKFNGVNFKDLIGFIQQFMNRGTYNLADRKELRDAFQNERLVGRREWQQRSYYREKRDWL